MALQYLLFLALVQGVTEFLPISSSAHLILGRDLMDALGVPPAQGSAEDELAFDIALHVGSLLAVLLYFRRDAALMALGLVDALTGRWGARSRLLLLIVVATIPILIVGFLARDSGHGRPARDRDHRLDDGPVSASPCGRRTARRRRSASRNELRLRDAVLIGLAQCLAVIPGVSRLGHPP